MSSAINENEGTFLEMVIGTRHLKIEYEKHFPQYSWMARVLKMEVSTTLVSRAKT